MYATLRHSTYSINNILFFYWKPNPHVLTQVRISYTPYKVYITPTTTTNYTEFLRVPLMPDSAVENPVKWQSLNLNH